VAPPAAPRSLPSSRYSHDAPRARTGVARGGVTLGDALRDVDDVNDADLEMVLLADRASTR
jgi:hypothetical protein